MRRLAAAAIPALLGVLVVVAGASPALASGSGPAPTITGSVVARRAAASFAAPASAPASAAHAVTGTVVTISSNCATFCYVPEQLSITQGDTVTWINRSSAEHTVTPCTPAACNGASGGTGTDKTFTSHTIGAAAGASFSHTFTQPGTYVYYCTIHGYASMHGTVTVVAPVATTTTAPPTTAAPTSPAPAPTTPPSPQLANTGGATNGMLALALTLIAVGLAATSFQVRRRPA